MKVRGSPAPLILKCKVLLTAGGEPKPHCSVTSVIEMRILFERGRLDDRKMATVSYYLHFFFLPLLLFDFTFFYDYSFI